MNSPASIVDSIIAAGIRLQLYEPRELVMIAPKWRARSITDAMREAVRVHKEEIIAHLKLTPQPKIRADLPPRPLKGEPQQVKYDKDGQAFWRWPGCSRWYSFAEYLEARKQWFASDGTIAGPGRSGEQNHKRDAKSIQSRDGSEPS